MRSHSSSSAAVAAVLVASVALFLVVASAGRGHVVGSALRSPNVSAKMFSRPMYQSSLQSMVRGGQAGVVRAVPPGGAPGTQNERTFIAIKPDGVQRRHIGEIIRRFESKGFKLVAMKLMQPTKQQAEGHYESLRSKPFFPDLANYFSSGPICAMVWEGKDVIATGRKMLGATNPAESAPGTIRGDLCIEVGRNVCHGSDGPDTAQREINYWFHPTELVDWGTADAGWIYENVHVAA